MDHLHKQVQGWDMKFSLLKTVSAESSILIKWKNIYLNTLIMQILVVWCYIFKVPH